MSKKICVCMCLCVLCAVSPVLSNEYSAGSSTVTSMLSAPVDPQGLPTTITDLSRVSQTSDAQDAARATNTRKVILVLNAGSSSVKYQVLALDTNGSSILAKGLVDRVGTEQSVIEHTRDCETFRFAIPGLTHASAMNMLLNTILVDKAQGGVIASLHELDGIGHRVVHGGEKFSRSVIIDDDVVKTISDCVPLAPLHNPANLAGIEACRTVAPTIMQVAVFDTAFHQTMPPKAFRYPIANKYYKEFGVRRYGFHGTSHYYVSQQAEKYLKETYPDRYQGDLKIITCHLGNGCSLAAIKGGKSVDTSMGMTPLEGLPMGSRSGTLDPGIFEFLEAKTGLSTQDITNEFNKGSGLLGVAGIKKNDMRDIRKAAIEGNEDAQLAIDIFVHRLQKIIGAYAAVLNGVDAIVFTAGMGENDALIRQEACENFSFLGAAIDPVRNTTKGTVEISTEVSAVKVLRIPTNEELVIAQDTYGFVTERDLQKEYESAVLPVLEAA